MNILMATKSGLMIYYFKYCFDSESFFSVAMVFFTVASVVGAMLIERFVHLFRDSNRAFLWIMAISMGLNVLYFLLILGMGMGAAASSIHFGLLFFVLILSGLFQGAHYGFPTLLLSNAVDYGEWKTKRSDIGVTFGLNSLAMSLGSAIGGTLVGFLLDAIHYVPNVSQTPSVQNGMLLGAILVPVALTAVQFVLHLFFGLTDEQHARCVRELTGQDTDRSEERAHS